MLVSQSGRCCVWWPSPVVVSLVKSVRKSYSLELGFELNVLLFLNAGYRSLLCLAALMCLCLFRVKEWQWFVTAVHISLCGVVDIDLYSTPVS